MKIEGFKTYSVTKPLNLTLVNSLYSLSTVEHILLEIYAEGLVGIGSCCCWGSKAQARAIRVLMEGYCEDLIGQDASMIGKHWSDAQVRMLNVGQTGLPVVAYSAVDQALWDLLGKAHNIPLYKMLGAQREEVTLYASGGWLGSVERLVEEAISFKEQGYRHFKMKMGSPDYHTDIDRVTAVKKAVGDDMEILIDVNQGWDVKTAVCAGKALQELGITYLEEPLLATDFKGHAELQAALDLNVCSGESLFTVTDFFELFRNNGVTMINPDLQKCGGVTEYKKICDLAAAYKIPVTSHVFTEFSVHLIASAPTGSLVEIIPGWSDDLYEEPIVVKDGKIKLSDAPGVGVTYDHELIRRYSHEE